LYQQLNLGGLKMKAASLAIFLLTMVFLVPSAEAQNCPPRAGMAANWCRPQMKPQVPQIPQNPYQSTPVYQQPGPVYQQPSYQQPAPVYQQPGYQQPGYQQPGYQQPGPPSQAYQIQCVVDGGSCAFLNSSPVPSGTACYCGNYPGFTQ
jgi:hypothetical protein